MMNSIWTNLTKGLSSQTLESTKKTVLDLVKGEQPQRELQLGIWGTTGSGKSTFLAALYNELLRTERWRVAADEKARKYLNQQLELLDNGRFPAATPEGKLEIYEYWLTGTEKDPRFTDLNVTLKFIDAPGRFYEEPTESAGKVAGMDMLDYMCGCDGIVFLLDPKRPARGEKLSGLLLKLMQEFQQRAIAQSQNKKVRPLEQYMAFCVTKADQDQRLWSEEELGGLPDELVKELVGKNFYASLEHTFCRQDRFQCFPVSAVGRYRENNRWESPILNLPSDQPDQSYGSSERWTYGFPQSNTPKDDVFAFPTSSGFSDNEATPNQQIDVSKHARPLNVLESVEWLIANVKQNPPALPPLKSNATSPYQ